MAETLRVVSYYLDPPGQYWVARGRTPVAAPPFTPPPTTTPFLLDDPGSVLDSTTKVLV